MLFDGIFAVKMRNAGGAVGTGARTGDEMSDSCRFGSLREGHALSGFVLGTLFIGGTHRIHSVDAACSAHQGIVVREVTASDLNPLLTQSLRCRRGSIARQSPDVMPSGH